MTVYDFDGTIYDGDSTVDLYLFCCRRYPLCLLVLPRALYAAILWKTNLYEKDNFKENFFRFLRYVPDIDKTVLEFWDANRHKIENWYLKQKKDTDLIISASPEFSLRSELERLGVRYICSPVDKKTGQLLGPNNSGTRKTDRFKEKFPGESIDEFYSDSHNDDPMAALATKAYWVRKGNISSWPASRKN